MSIWTPGTKPPQGPLTIYVPGRYAEQARPFICRVPTGRDRTCGERFSSQDALLRHVKACVSRHEQQTHDESPRQRMPVFDANNWDPEIDAHMRALGKRMRAEGRWTVRPSERAGFS